MYWSERIDIGQIHKLLKKQIHTCIVIIIRSSDFINQQAKHVNKKLNIRLHSKNNNLILLINKHRPTEVVSSTFSSCFRRRKWFQIGALAFFFISIISNQSYNATVQLSVAFFQRQRIRQTRVCNQILPVTIESSAYFFF